MASTAFNEGARVKAMMPKRQAILVFVMIREDTGRIRIVEH
jgi:hypothetical protein